MKKLAAFAAAAVIGAFLAAAAWQDDSAQDAADYATRNGIPTCNKTGQR
jgi:ferric-dicitrate binding protein FerR (iron transport regulator)